MSLRRPRLGRALVAQRPGLCEQGFHLLHVFLLVLRAGGNAGVLTAKGCGELVAMQRAVEQVYVSEPIGFYIVDLIAATRASGKVDVGASPRGSLAVMKLARCRAALFGRDFVTPEDVKAVAVPALSHRLMLRPELWVRRVRPEEVVLETLETVPTPAAEDVRA